MCVCVLLKTNHTGGATNPSRSKRFVVTVVLVLVCNKTNKWFRTFLINYLKHESLFV